MHQQFTKCLKIRKIQYYCLENIHIVTNTVLNEGYIMGCNILRQALGLYNHFDTHEAEYYSTYLITVVIRTLPYRCVCVRVCVCARVCVNSFVSISK